MTHTHPTGYRETRDGHDFVVLTRQFPAAVEDVWAAVTEPDRLARWVDARPPRELSLGT